MSRQPPPQSADAVTAIVLEVFRLNGRLIAAGDALVAPLGLSSARWQVLGAVALAGEPQTVADIARGMGLARQSVQRLVNELVPLGLLVALDNPRHRRAKRIALTPQGAALYRRAMARQRPWARRLGHALDAGTLGEAAALLRALRRRLERKRDAAAPRRGEAP